MDNENNSQLDESVQRKPERYIVIALLLFILVVSPFLSWYYLKSGVDYRKKSLSELQNYGQFDYFNFALIPQKAISADSMKSRITIAAMIDSAGIHGNRLTETMNKLHVQFKDRKDVALITFLCNADSIAAQRYSEVNNPKHALNYSVAAIGNAARSALLQGLKLGQKGDFSAAESPYLVYINADGVVANFYDVNDTAHLAKLVEHIAMKLKIDPFETPEIRREKEK